MKLRAAFFSLFMFTGCFLANTSAKYQFTECSVLPNIDMKTISDSYNKNRKLWKALNLKYADHDKRKLVIFFDGTGNNGKDRSNIREMYNLAVKEACNGKAIIPFYDKGVGAKWFDFFSGGVTGHGISKNIRQGYRFLVEAYQPCDEIFIFGFSRGAFTARSLNGMIELAGLLDKNSVKKDAVGEINQSDLIQKASAIYDCYHIKQTEGTTIQSLVKQNIKENKRLEKTTFIPVVVEAIGVFDTVSALGPKRKADPETHHLNLYANNGFHALSIDEQRKDFKLVRFNHNIKPSQSLREVWFAGVHSNIGGGYDSGPECNTSNPCEKDYLDGLETTTLNWMISNFKKYGLFPLNSNFNECRLGRMHDEFYDTKVPPYSKLGKYIRPIKDGDMIHISVMERINNEIPIPNKNRECKKRYNPTNLPDSYKIVNE